MDAHVVIDSYVNNIAARLPRTLRNDVGVELRTLLLEQLTRAAADIGCEPDEKLAIEVARRFGRPEEVAARYSPRGFQIIEPEHAPAFVKLSAVCVAIQWALTLPAVFASRTTPGEWWLSRGFGALAWVGIFVIWFGLAAWIRRRSPVDPESLSRPWTHILFWLPLPADWRPFDRDAFERRAELGALPLGVAVTIFFVAPAWFLGFLTPTGTNTSWALYDEHFRHSLLPALIVLMVVRLALCAAALINARLRARLEAFRFGLWVCFVGLLYWTVFSGSIFAGPVADALFKAWLLIFLLVNTIQIAVWIRRALTQVRVPKSLA
ncbi:MAG: hypothetical protein WDO56_36185 [Gammaproteobacteria bacterium]